MISIAAFTYNPFQENTYVLYDDTKAAIVIDPGCSSEYEREDLKSFIKQEGLTVEKLVNTHCHIDHMIGNAFVAEHYGVELYAHKNEVPILAAGPSYGANYGFAVTPSPDIAHFIEETQSLEFGNSTLEIIFTPGHSPGSVSFYSAAQKFIIGGDVLFQGSIGRYDLPGSDGPTLFRTLIDKMMALPDDVTVYSGHGPATTIGAERVSNPFLQGA